MYQAVGSRGSRVSRVLWMLEELGEPYEFVEIKLRSPRAYELNPSGKVPVLIDADLVITDSAAICVYLADKHAEKVWARLPGLEGAPRWTAGCTSPNPSSRPRSGTSCATVSCCRRSCGSMSALRLPMILATS